MITERRICLVEMIKPGVVYTVWLFDNLEDAIQHVCSCAGEVEDDVRAAFTRRMGEKSYVVGYHKFELQQAIAYDEQPADLLQEAL